MVSLDVRPSFPSARGETGRDGTRTEWLVVAGAAAAALGAAVAMALLSAITVLLWACGPLATDGVSAAPFRGSASLWLMGQRAPLDAGTYDLVLPPLFVTAVVAVLVARLAGWAARTTAAHELTPAAIVGGGVVLGHVVVAGLAAWVSDRAGGGVELVDAMRAALLFSVPCAAAGVAPQTWVWARIAARWGLQVRLAARAAALGAVALAAGGALVLMVSLLVHHRSAAALFTMVGGGIGGGAGTTLLCLAMAPNAVLWVVALAAGPGFALGADGGLSLAGDMHGGALPAMPLLAALPGEGSLPAYAVLLLALPLGAGGVVGWYARPASGTRGWREELITAATAGVLCGLGVGVLAGLSGGGTGGRLANFGPSGLLVGAFLALQLAGAALVLAAGRIAWEHYRGPTAPTAPPAKGPLEEKDAQPEPAAAAGEPAVAEDSTGVRRFAIPRQLPWQLSRLRAKGDQGPGSPDPSGPGTASIVVVEASEVDDLPLSQVDSDAPENPTDIEDTQELPAVTDEE